MAAIFGSLLDEESSEIRLRPMRDCVALNQPVNFLTIVEAARRRGESQRSDSPIAAAW